MPNGKEMTKIALPEGGSITVGERFWINKKKFIMAVKNRQDADKIIKMIKNFGPGPYLVLGIIYFHSCGRKNYYFLRFKNINEKDQMINKKYCY